MRKINLELKNYFYLSKDDINMLYNQISEHSITRETKSTEFSKSGELKVKGGIPRILNGEISGILDSKDINNFEFSKETEQKISDIIKFLENNEDCYTELDVASKNVIINNNSCYINIREKFNVPQFFPNNINKTNIKEIGFIEFSKNMIEIGNYQYNDEYYKTLPYKYAMNASLNNLRYAGSSDYSLTHHLSFKFRESQGEGISIGIFGNLSQIKEKYLYIKPIALWF
ncbi:MAG: hypothetical protein A2014_05580 [Spirochaetes bacterium GWF1_49_6]|nr:MAG: hypothetical protein A2014_05580 [Spirochaetes bacterium GWF1_49_6]